MTSMIKKLSIALIAGVVAALSFVAPAFAGTLTSASVTATGSVANSGTNAYPITVAATTITATDEFVINLPTGWSATFSSGPTCGGITLSGINITNTGCNVSGTRITLYGSDGTNQANIPVGAKTVTFQVGKLNTATARDFVITSSNTGTVVDTVTTSLAAAAATYGANFLPNGGTGTNPTPQSSNTGTTVMPTTTMTKAGFTFAGWRSGNATVGTVYQAGETAPLTANTNFYAQWSDNSASGGSSDSLANTGFNGTPYLVAGLALAIVGAGLLLFARRKRSN